MLLKPLYAVFALGCHLTTLGAMMLFILFLHGSLPSTWMLASTQNPLAAVCIDLGLVALWSLQHTGMASPAFKAWSGRLIPLPLERAVYCLATALALGLLVLGWVPIPGTLLSLAPGPASAALDYCFWSVWALFGLTVLLDRYLEFFGLQQVYCYIRGRPFSMSSFKTNHFHRFVRHPTLSCIIFGVWITPNLTVSHLCFAALMTLYTVLGAYSVDNKFVRYYGQPYIDRRGQVPLLFPRVGLASLK